MRILNLRISGVSSNHNICDPRQMDHFSQILWLTTIPTVLTCSSEYVPMSYFRMAFLSSHPNCVHSSWPLLRNPSFSENFPGPSKLRTSFFVCSTPHHKDGAQHKAPDSTIIISCEYTLVYLTTWYRVVRGSVLVLLPHPCTQQSTNRWQWILKKRNQDKAGKLNSSLQRPSALYL